MNTRRWLPIAVVAALGLIVTMNQARGLGRARERVTTANGRMATTHAKVQEILDLRADEERIALSARPERDVIAQINATLAVAGLRSDRFKNLQNESDVAIASRAGSESSYRRQALSFLLESLTPAEIGAFLEAWREGQSVWVPTRIELHHARTQAQPAVRYNASIVVTATYLADETTDRG